MSRPCASAGGVKGKGRRKEGGGVETWCECRYATACTSCHRSAGVCGRPATPRAAFSSSACSAARWPSGTYTSQVFTAALHVMFLATAMWRQDLHGKAELNDNRCRRATVSSSKLYTCQPERLQRRHGLRVSGSDGRAEASETSHDALDWTNVHTQVEAPAGWSARPARRRGRGGRRSGTCPAAARYCHVLGPGASAPPSPPYDAPAATGKLVASLALQSSLLNCWPAS